MKDALAEKIENIEVWLVIPREGVESSVACGEADRPLRRLVIPREGVESEAHLFPRVTIDSAASDPERGS